MRHIPWWVYPRIVFRAFFTGALAGFFSFVFALTHGVRGYAAWAPGITFAVVAVGWEYVREIKSIRKEMRKELIQYFDGRRPPFCLSCGYDLRGSTSDICTECGQSTLSVPTLVGRFCRFLGRKIGHWHYRS